MVVHGQWGVPYDHLPATVSRVCQIHGEEAAEALLNAYPRSEIRGADCSRKYGPR